MHPRIIGLNIQPSFFYRRDYMASFWYHGRMYNEEDIETKMNDYEAIIKALEQKIQELEEKLRDIDNE